MVINQQNQQASMLESFTLLFKNKMMLLVTLANILGSLGFGASLVTYFFKYEIPADFLGDNDIIGVILDRFGKEVRIVPADCLQSIL